MTPVSNERTDALLEAILVQLDGTRPPAPTNHSVERQVHWVNGLWFAALACSLSTALIAMLAKQWLQAYTPSRTGTPHSMARQRQSKYMQLIAWRIPTLVEALPLLLHIALLLFFAGLIVLLWNVDLVITLATWMIVGCAYVFYLTSIILPLVYPDCPYQHPISEYIRQWKDAKPAERAGQYVPHKKDLESGSFEQQSYADHSLYGAPEDVLDAQCLVWLFSKSTDPQVIATALQSIAGLPRDFSALKILRDGGALHLVEEGFQRCFHKDTTVDLQWHLIDADGAELYTRAWIKLTRETKERWPFEMLEPLWMLQDLKSYPDVAAISSCAVALSSFDSHVSQWELLNYLAKCVAGEVQLSSATQCCLLDSIIQCMVEWEMPVVVLDETAARAVPVLLRLMHALDDQPTSNVGRAAALALHVCVVRPLQLNWVDYLSEDKRKADYCEIMVEALSMVVDNPGRFGVKDSVLDIAAHQLCRLATPVVVQSERFPPRLKAIARSSLSSLYATGKVGVGTMTDSSLANVLQLLFPPTNTTEHLAPLLVSTLVETLEISSHPDITRGAMRLLEFVLTNCSDQVADAFMEHNGISIVLRVATTRDSDTRAIEIDTLRTLCAFIASSTRLHDDSEASAKRIESIFSSTFFETLCLVIASRRWWLLEVSGQWAPALVNLCQLRPEEHVWTGVVKTLRAFAERNVNEEGCMATLAQLDHIAALSSSTKDVEASTAKSSTSTIA